MHNKKAAESNTLWLVIAAIIAFSVLFILLTFFQKGTESTKKVMAGYIEALTEDFDNDRINDFYDKSPCVAGEDLVVVEEGVTYYYFSDLGDDGGCSEEEFGGVYTFYKDSHNVEKFKLEKKLDINTETQVCVIPDKFCARALKNTYEELKEQEG